MVTSITIGQFYPTDSFIHRLDPRIKLFGTFVYITMLFLLQNVAGFIFAAMCLTTIICLSKVPLKFMLRGLKMIMFLIVFTAGINILFTNGETKLASFWVFTITLEGAIIAVKMTVRLIMLILGASILTLTTSPIQLTDAIEYCLNPLKKIGVPAHEIAMMMTIALRFIPTLLEEMDKIMKAQMARGADFDTGGVVKKAKSLIPLLVPLFISAFRRADELSVAMEARCYQGGGGRTKMKIMKFAGCDYKALACTFVFISGILFINIIL